MIHPAQICNRFTTQTWVYWVMQAGWCKQYFLPRRHMKIGGQNLEPQQRWCCELDLPGRSTGWYPCTMTHSHKTPAGFPSYLVESSTLETFVRKRPTQVFKIILWRSIYIYIIHGSKPRYSRRPFIKEPAHTWQYGYEAPQKGTRYTSIHYYIHLSIVIYYIQYAILLICLVGDIGLFES